MAILEKFPTIANVAGTAKRATKRKLNTMAAPYSSAMTPSKKKQAASVGGVGKVATVKPIVKAGTMPKPARTPMIGRNVRAKANLDAQMKSGASASTAAKASTNGSIMKNFTARQAGMKRK